MIFVQLTFYRENVILGQKVNIKFAILQVL